MKRPIIKQILVSILLVALTWFLTKKFGTNDTVHKAVTESEMLKSQLDSSLTLVSALRMENEAKDALIGSYLSQIEKLNSTNKGFLEEIGEDSKRTRTYVRSNYRMLVEQNLEKRRKLSESAQTIKLIKE